MLFTEKRIATGETSPGFAVNGSVYLGNKSSLGLTYSLRNEEFGNLGFHAVTSLGALQIFAVADNILPVLDPLNNKNVDLRFGMNIAFKQRYETMTKKKQAKVEAKKGKKVESEENAAIEKDKKRKKRKLKKRLRQEDTQTN